MRRDSFFPSAGDGSIHVARWEPEGTVRCVLQIIHGIADFAERYDEFAKFLNQQGILVVAEDHMGHGLSTSAEYLPGYFTGGWFAAVEDTYYLLQETRQEFPELPYMLFGHSMGSFMAQTILQKYPNCGISGCILCGSGWQPEAALSAGLRIAETACRIYGETVPNPRLQNLLFKAYNLRVEHPRTPYDWVNRVNRDVDVMLNHPQRYQAVTGGLARDMLMGISYIQREENLLKMQKSLPVLLISGGDDPVGSYGEGVRKIAEAYDRVGMERVCVRIYPLCRHEILHELNKNEIFADILHWIETVIKS